MCGRFVLEIDEAGLLHSYVATKGGDGRDWTPTYSIAPSTMAPVVREHVDDDGQTVRTVEPARWGLQPAWAKEKGPRPINARYEGVTSNGMFRSAFASQRLVVPMSGYYEWVEMPDGKQPYYVHPESGGLLHAAGLAAARREGEGWAVTFTIITREARDAAGQVHDRMPAYLPEDMLAEWLAPGKLEPAEREYLHAELGAVSEAIARDLVTHPVDRKVNSTRAVDRSDPALIEAVEVD